MGENTGQKRVTGVKRLAAECGFELAGIAPAAPLAEEVAWYREWARRGHAAGMSYLKDRRAEVRADPRNLLPSARSVLCLGRLYNTRQPYSTGFQAAGHAWISRYAWGEDYHDVLRRDMERLVSRLRETLAEPFEWKICVDTAPLLERSYARRAGLGWIGKNTCLIREGAGSWFFLGEILLSLELAPDALPPDRCGTCTRCIDACPTRALVPTGLASGPAFTVDAGRCISYLTIESRDAIPEPLQPGLGRHLFGCDICQDVCPWNRKAPVTAAEEFQARHFAPPVDVLEKLDEEGFEATFRASPVRRAGYRGFRRSLDVVRRNQGR